ncbi:MAG TPA: ROK family protein [Chloroflexia bacterium]|nr:ROK family protein [Chloroflexia bacterium]
MSQLPNTRPELLAGVDVGGTKIAVLVVDGQGQVCGHTSTPTPLNSPESTLDGIVTAIRRGLVAAHASLSDLGAVGVGIPGRVDTQTGVVRLAVNLRWQEMPAGAQLGAALGVPCFLENDVRLGALGLQRHPDYAHIQDLAYISIGTGIAAGLILNGRLYRGAHGMAGEVGHMIIDPAGPRCACGLHGCLEALTAGPAIARLGQQAITAGADTQLRHYQPVTAAAVYQAARAGDAVAQAIATQTGRYLAYALQQLVMAYDMERVVVGGGVARAGDPFLQPILEELARLRQDSALARELLPAEKFHLLPPDFDAGTWGAVALASQGLRRTSHAIGVI